MLFKLVLKNIFKNLGLAFLVIFTIFVVVFSFTIFDYIYHNMKVFFINESGFTQKNKVIIKKQYKNKFDNFLFDSLDKVYNDLKKDKNIKKSYAFYTTKIPTSIDVKFMGYNFYTDIFLYASDKIIDTGNNLKLGLSSTVLNIYNTQMQGSTLFPKINLSTLKNIKIDVYLGKNSFFKMKKFLIKKGVVSYIDNEFPLFGFTISKKQAIEIEKRLGIESLKIYKIVVIVNKYSYIEKLKKKYPYLDIQGYNDVEQKITRKLAFVKHIFDIIRMVVCIVFLAFIIIVSVLIYNKNKHNINVLYYNGASFLKRFAITFGEINFYVLSVIIITVFSVFIFNLQIPKINKKIEERGFVNMKLETIRYENLVKNILELYLIMILISFYVTIKKI